MLRIHPARPPSPSIAGEPAHRLLTSPRVAEFSRASSSSGFDRRMSHARGSTRGKPPCADFRPAARLLRGLDGEAVLVPNVGLEPTLSCEDRILSPARPPSVRHWADVDLTLIPGLLLRSRIARGSRLCGVKSTSGFASWAALTRSSTSTLQLGTRRTPARLFAAVDGGDHLHPGTERYTIMAAAVELTLFGRCREWMAWGWQAAAPGGFNRSTRSV
jgi:hypothetical protein